MSKKIAVVGGGITGLSIAYRARKNGDDVILFEASKHVGGKISTIHSEGLELPLGPITISENPSLVELFQELGLEMIEATNTEKRYIFSRGKLHKVGLTSSLLSLGGKLALLKAPLSSKPQQHETVSAYATRRFGEEAYRRMFNPLMNGVYAGDAELLSATSVFKKRGPRKIISLKGGVAALTNALAMKLGDSIKTNSPINDLSELKNFDEVYLTTPAFVTAALIKELKEPLQSIRYSDVTQIYLETIPGENKFDGFGFLIPHEEKMSLLGAICISNIFPSKVPEGRRLFVLFCGGDRSYPFTPSVDEAVKEFNKILQPALTKVIHVQDWKKAIPQPYVGHEKIVEAVRDVEQKNPRIKIKGNYLSGVAVGDCV